MNVAVRFSVRRAPDVEAGAVVVVAIAFGISVASVAVAGEPSDWDPSALWPFAIVGIAMPGIAQIIYTMAIREAGPARAGVYIATFPALSAVLAIILLGEPVRVAIIV